MTETPNVNSFTENIDFYVVRLTVQGPKTTTNALVTRTLHVSRPDISIIVTEQHIGVCLTKYVLRDIINAYIPVNVSI